MNEPLQFPPRVKLRELLDEDGHPLPTRMERIVLTVMTLAAAVSVGAAIWAM